MMHATNEHQFAALCWASNSGCDAMLCDAMQCNTSVDIKRIAPLQSLSITLVVIVINIIIILQKAIFIQ